MVYFYHLFVQFYYYFFWVRPVVFGFFVVELKSFDKYNCFGLANGFSLSKVVARLTQSLDVTVLKGDSSKCKRGGSCTSKSTVFTQFWFELQNGGFFRSIGGAVDVGSSLVLNRLFETSSVGRLLNSFRAVNLKFCITVRIGIYSPL